MKTKRGTKGRDLITHRPVVAGNEIFVVIYAEGKRFYKTVVEATTRSKARSRFARENPDTRVVTILSEEP